MNASPMNMLLFNPGWYTSVVGNCPGNHCCLFVTIQLGRYSESRVPIRPSFRHAHFVFLLPSSRACAVAVVRLCFSMSWEFTVGLLHPGNYYIASNGEDINACECNTVTYTLIGARTACQGGSYAE
ncbi:hypothetical protein PISMIDRAFT_345286 [Pisolithus microcarpus 441]|uniref:Uncharacterized protein n=1 Tax=Pisolithus microcarpus 441 TaxID=765257 RepID=A0A0C9Z405_9AGAM|nr:hypothetical protein BKA83DRAFT_345286 [Pisolithus microcarpus]KIK14758.1 hypothetical protein PISMIDRAFT_345286 [Pisolithus microcarpus 441]